MARTTLATGLSLVLTLGALAGCNTVEGVGMDISTSARTVGGWFSGR